jgi:hypothetical protein
MISWTVGSFVRGGAGVEGSNGALVQGLAINPSHQLERLYVNPASPWLPKSLQKTALAATTQLL